MEYNPQFIISIIKNIENVIRRNLTDQEENLCINCIKSVPPNAYKHYPPNTIIKTITSTVIDELELSSRQTHPQQNALDIHEILKQNMKISHEPTVEKKTIDVSIESMFGVRNISSLVEKLNKSKMIKSTYLLLDSRYRNIENDGTEYFKWCNINNACTSQGSVNYIGEMQDIISIKLMQFRLPLAKNVNNIYKRVTVLIHELGSQACVAHEGRKFHFMCMPCRDNPSPGWLELCADDHCKGEYKFAKPITILDNITISFGSPLDIIKFDPDRGQGRIISYDTITTIDFKTNHNLSTNDVIYITDFNTINPGDSCVINNMNNPQGLTATVISPNTITVPVNSSSIIMNLSGTVDSSNRLLAGQLIVISGDKLVTGIGTSFGDIAENSFIKISNQVFQISKILNDNQLTITNPANFSGTFSYRSVSNKLFGNGTSFNRELNIGDRILVNNIPQFIKSIESDTEITLNSIFNGDDGVNFPISKNNSINMSHDIYFGPKRIFMLLEVIYLE